MATRAQSSELSRVWSERVLGLKNSVQHYHTRHFDAQDPLMIEEFQF
jgi:hypothetical protein